MDGKRRYFTKNTEKPVSLTAQVFPEKEDFEKTMEEKYIKSNEQISGEDFTISITDPMVYDRLHTLSVEYTVPVSVLVNAAVERLLDDVEFVRKLRNGNRD